MSGFGTFTLDFVDNRVERLKWVILVYFTKNRVRHSVSFFFSLERHSNKNAFHFWITVDLVMFFSILSRYILNFRGIIAFVIYDRIEVSLSTAWCSEESLRYGVRGFRGIVSTCKFCSLLIALLEQT